MTPQTGLVVRIDAKRCHVEVDGRVYLLSPRGRLFEGARDVKHPIAVGDRVVVRLDGEGGGSVEEVLPRTSRLARAAAGGEGREQVLVANLDLVLVVSSILEPPFRPGLVDRILAGAEREEIEARLVVNKIDLETGAGSDPSSESWCTSYTGLGYSCARTSARTGAGIDELRQMLAGRITVFCGLSGVGKSSLLNAVQPGLSLRVGVVSRGRHRGGRHTTTHTALLDLTGGGHVVDTPGIRNFGLFDLDPTEVAWLFREMRPWLGQCSFDDCSHSHEPDCKIKHAVAGGQIGRGRYDSYLDLLADARAGQLGG